MGSALPAKKKNDDVGWPKKKVWSKRKQHQKNVCTSPVICGWAQINIIEKWTGKTLKQEMS